jgi:hypothetical protein
MKLTVAAGDFLDQHLGQEINNKESCVEAAEANNYDFFELDHVYIPKNLWSDDRAITVAIHILVNKTMAEERRLDKAGLPCIVVGWLSRVINYDFDPEAEEDFMISSYGVGPKE